MDNKYYIPKIEDLCIGYKCELLKNNNWVEKTMNFEYQPLIKKESWILVNKDLTDCVRTKYLDKEDIESLGWKEVVSLMKTASCFERNGFGITFMQDIHFINIYNIYEDKRLNATKFHGSVKSINELKTLLKMLCL